MGRLTYLLAGIAAAFVSIGLIQLGAWSGEEAWIFALIWAPVAVINVRARLRDMGDDPRTWWFCIVPIYNLYFGLRLLLVPGQGRAGENKYLLFTPLALALAAFATAGVHETRRSSAGRNEPTSADRARAPTFTPSESTAAAEERPKDTMRLFDKGGNAVDVPYAYATGALSSGNYGLPAGTMISMKMVDDRIVDIPIEKIGDAVAKGGRVATPDDIAHAARGADAGRRRGR